MLRMKNDTPPFLLADKIKTVILQSLLHYGKYSLDSLVICCFHETVRNFDFDTAVREIKKEMNQKIDTVSCKKTKSNYSNFLELRNKIYLEPQIEWDARSFAVTSA